MTPARIQMLEDLHNSRRQQLALGHIRGFEPASRMGVMVNTNIIFILQFKHNFSIVSNLNPEMEQRISSYGMLQCVSM